MLLLGLLLNLCWVPLYIINIKAALILLFAMIVVAVKSILLLMASDKLAGRSGLWQHAFIFSPYLAWICFAFTLNAYLAIYCRV